MNEFEKYFIELKNRFSKKEEINYRIAINRLQELAIVKLESSRTYYFIKKVIEITDGNKDAYILDYGSGGGMLITYLHFLGYTSLRGVDVNSQDRNNKFAQCIGMDPNTFISYDKKILPFESETFDLVASETVLEHVQDIDAYYREAARVLRPGGVLFCYFPHRLIPFDSHSRTWFIHYAPKSIRKHLYNRYTTESSEYFEKILNFKRKGYHVRTAMNYFNRYEDVTAKRIRDFTYAGKYEGNINLRQLAGKLMHLPLLGKGASHLLKHFADADLHFFK